MSQILTALPTNIRQSWKGLIRTIVPACYDHSKITVVKRFITLGSSVVNLAVVDDMFIQPMNIFYINKMIITVYSCSNIDRIRQCHQGNMNQ
jgi:hypothetical protein